MTTPIDRLREIMAQLRNPDGGCAWDIAQSFETIAPYTIEEAYEVADAIERGNLDDLRDELGDLLLQVVFHAQMAAEDGTFDFDDVATAICEKLVRRHPHVFSDGAARTPAEIKLVWDEIKAEERAKKPDGIIDDVPANLPSLVRAEKLQSRMARVGFDWPDTDGVLDKVSEELGELTEAVRAGEMTAAEAEFGDLLFTLVNHARHLGLDADAALRGTNARFATRVRHMEQAVKADGGRMDELDADAWERAWQRAKTAEQEETA
ncbi:nucleoside triphosphate pyrophosphohydrolase [Acuticoccus mangrovi]|uniref:Nucleoside triphosphate pyrophosphohydrolase n=1 Tax=Acuticoccus mangrovi TaxID=2796142 RepID=A0A934MG92_9HYPH|nr:nucleoside triphosphate pyrophosphohydrolase [Acuticoccus mangrovi]MBJ3774716.1 nucleoside triphosphate pyrophosphohydrolase [Acuticoccus mangrovi]